MRSLRSQTESDGFATLESFESDLLSSSEERDLLRSLGECKSKLASALNSVQTPNEIPDGGDAPQLQALYIAEFYSRNSNPQAEAALGAVYRKYSELRSKLAMANMRLVAHVAKRFKDRGVSYSDLLQEGFCGLLEAIDRFDVTHETKLATYATWWIRQAMQRAVAAGAYPVRLSPRHLRQLAQSQQSDDLMGQSESSSEMIQRIHAATRPTVSLNASYDGDRGFTLLQTMSDNEGNVADDLEMDETIGKLIETLRPREQEVLALRFGLRGKSKLSLSQVGKVLAVSKERVRQIQDRALTKLRSLAIEHKIDETMLTI
jgi:RNA polymerase primary sigma factor